jgi:predicted metal-dependent peptidase
MDHTTPDAATRLANARIRLLLRDPFWGSLAMSITFAENPQEDTACTDGTTIWYNPTFVAGLSPAQCTTLVAHEVAHCALRHYDPLLHHGRDAEILNIACDHVVNLALSDAGYTPLPNWYCSPLYKGLSVLDVYNRLLQTNGPRALAPLIGRVVPAQTTIDWAVATVAAAQYVSQRGGKLPQIIQQQLTALLHPRIDWRAVLAQFLERVTVCDWTRPSRRWLSTGVWLPTRTASGWGPVVVAVDGSGSIDPHTAQQFLGEVEAMLSLQPQELHVLTFDTQITHVAIYRPGEPFQLPPIGHGGTDFCPVFDYADTLPSVTAVVLLTDGYGEFPAVSPEYPVCWALTTSTPVPFGQVLRLN